MIKLNLFSIEENSSRCRKEETWLKVERVLIMKMNKYPSVARLIVSYMSFHVIKKKKLQTWRSADKYL